MADFFPNRLGGFIDPQNYRKRMKKFKENLGLPKLNFQVIRPTIDHVQSKERNAQGHPGTAAALAAGHDDRRLHAGDSGKREGNDRNDQPGTAKAVTGGGGFLKISGQFPAKLVPSVSLSC